MKFTGIWTWLVRYQILSKAVRASNYLSTKPTIFIFYMLFTSSKPNWSWKLLKTDIARYVFFSRCRYSGYPTISRRINISLKLYRLSIRFYYYITFVIHIRLRTWSYDKIDNFFYLFQTNKKILSMQWSIFCKHTNRYFWKKVIQEI